MGLAEIMQGIEQYGFSSELNLAVGTKAFRRGLREHVLVRRLTGLAKDAEVRLTLAKRIEELSGAEIDEHYENPFDAALSAYLTVLQNTADLETVAKAASEAAKAPNCWWAVGLSRELLVRAVATGLVEAPLSRRSFVPADFAQVSARREVLREKMQEWFSPGTVPLNDDTTQRILAMLRTPQPRAQVLKPSNVIDMPTTMDAGTSLTERPRGSRTLRLKVPRVAASPHLRAGRQAMRA